MIPEPILNIRIQPSPSGNLVSIGSNRALNLTHAFVGQSPERALATLPLLFSLCGTAQSVAAVSAVESGQGISPDPQTLACRRALVMLETIKEHGWRILLDWPKFLGLPPMHQPLAQLLRLRMELMRLLLPDSSALMPGVVLTFPQQQSWRSLHGQMQELLERALFGMPLKAWLALEDELELFAWAQQTDTLAARYCQHLMSMGWLGLGACSAQSLLIQDYAELTRCMSDPQFIAQPSWQGQAKESTCLGRTESKLIHQLSLDYGNGLMVRLVARLTEMAQQVVALADFQAISPEGFAPVTGLGVIPAARGLLAHRVQIQGGRVSEYQILAPTEWNFHPQGVVAQGLAQLDAGQAELEQQARLFIEAVDPCVAYQLEVAHA